MSESFTLIVPYNNAELAVEAELRMLGYTHKIAIELEGNTILFEPDEERNYRAVLPEQSQKEPDRLLLKAIAEELERAFK